MREYKILNTKIHKLAEYEVKTKLHEFLNSPEQHQIMTVNPEFLIEAQNNDKFAKIINAASLATIDGSGLVYALQFLGHDVSLDDRLTGVELTNTILSMAINEDLRVLFCLNNYGLTPKDEFFMAIKDKYPHLEFQVADQKTTLEKAKIFFPHIILVGLGAPEQDIWIAENLKKISSAKIAVGVGGTFDFISGKIKRAPKIMRSFGLEWLWRLSMQPSRIKRIFTATLIFPYVIIKYKYFNKNKNV